LEQEVGSSAEDRNWDLSKFLEENTAPLDRSEFFKKKGTLEYFRWRRIKRNPLKPKSDPCQDYPYYYPGYTLQQELDLRRDVVDQQPKDWLLMEVPEGSPKVGSNDTQCESKASLCGQDLFIQFQNDHVRDMPKLILPFFVRAEGQHKLVAIYQISDLAAAYASKRTDAREEFLESIPDDARWTLRYPAADDQVRLFFVNGVLHFEVLHDGILHTFSNPPLPFFIPGANSEGANIQGTLIDKDKSLCRKDCATFTITLARPFFSVAGSSIWMIAKSPLATIPGLWNGQPDEEEGQIVKRRYTLIKSGWQSHQMELPVRLYPQEEQGMVGNQQMFEPFPDGGRMTRVLDDLKYGDKVEFTRMAERLDFTGNRNLIDYRTNKWHHFHKICLMAGGSGIVAFMRALKLLDDTEVVLFYSNVSRDYSMFEQELADLEKEHEKLTILRGFTWFGGWTRERYQPPAFTDGLMYTSLTEDLVQEYCHDADLGITSGNNEYVAKLRGFFEKMNIDFLRL
jgi:hypothetical protein